MKIVSLGFVEGFYYRPRVDKELLRQYHEGIIALSACLAGEVPRYLTRGLYEEARQTALNIRKFLERTIIFWSFRITESRIRDSSISSFCG